MSVLRGASADVTTITLLPAARLNGGAEQRLDFITHTWAIIARLALHLSDVIFIIRSIDLVQHPSKTYVHGLGACEYKNMSTLDVFL
jgi:hypothetical protein